MWHRRLRRSFPEDCDWQPQAKSYKQLPQTISQRFLSHNHLPSHNPPPHPQTPTHKKSRVTHLASIHVFSPRRHLQPSHFHLQHHTPSYKPHGTPKLACSLPQKRASRLQIQLAPHVQLQAPCASCVGGLFQKLAHAGFHACRISRAASDVSCGNFMSLRCCSTWRGLNG